MECANFAHCFPKPKIHPEHAFFCVLLKLIPYLAQQKKRLRLFDEAFDIQCDLLAIA